MTIKEFNIKKGLYIFELEEFETEFHSHPVIEIIIANKGKFTIWTSNETHSDLEIAILPPNLKHKLSSTKGQFKTIMIEHHNRLVFDNLNLSAIELCKGYFSQTKADQVLQIEQVIHSIYLSQGYIEYDDRIRDTINYLNENDVKYDSMIKTLRSITNLSESRLSHLFKSNVGVSLKKYLVWTKLKSTIQIYLDHKDDLFSALIKSGFYDQPHFSKNFKNMLGVNPSKAYNSGMLQV